jgi:hypothetical protein
MMPAEHDAENGSMRHSAGTELAVTAGASLNHAALQHANTHAYKPHSPTGAHSAFLRFFQSRYYHIVVITLVLMELCTLLADITVEVRCRQRPSPNSQAWYLCSNTAAGH